MGVQQVVPARMVIGGKSASVPFKCTRLNQLDQLMLMDEGLRPTLEHLLPVVRTGFPGMKGSPER